MILDTTFLIDFLKGNTKAINFLMNNQEVFCTSTISVFEIMLNATPSESRKLMDMFEELRIFDFDLESSLAASKIFKELKEAGQEIDAEDCMIAGTAISNEEKVVTRNIKHFSRIKKLQIEEY